MTAFGLRCPNETTARPTLMSDYVRYTSRPEKIADAIVKDARRANPDLASVVELHAGQLSRNELLAVMRAMFVELAMLNKTRRPTETSR